MKYSHRIKARNKFKTSYKLAMALQLNSADSPVIVQESQHCLVVKPLLIV